MRKLIIVLVALSVTGCASYTPELRAELAEYRAEQRLHRSRAPSVTSSSVYVDGKRYGVSVTTYPSGRSSVAVTRRRW